MKIQRVLEKQAIDGRPDWWLLSLDCGHTIEVYFYRRLSRTHARCKRCNIIGETAESLYHEEATLP